MTIRGEGPPRGPSRAVPELVALLAKMRAEDPYWTPHVVQGVVSNAATVGLTWPQTVVGLVRLAVDMDARPGELIPDSRDPLRRRPITPPTEAWREAKAKITGERQQ